MLRGATGDMEAADMADSRKVPGRSPYRSLWKANVAAFAFLVLFSAGTTMWQIHHMDQLFIRDAEEHARLAANIIEINAKSSLLASEALEEIISVFLQNSITFIDFLQSVEPFTRNELKAFAQKTGLAGVTIAGQGKVVESSRGWLPVAPAQLCPKGEKGEKFISYPEQGLYLVARQAESTKSCIVAGIRNERIAALYSTINIRHTLKEISGLKGIRYVKMVEGSGAGGTAEQRRPLLKSGPEGYVVEVALPLSRNTLLVMGIDATPLQSRHRLRWMFFIMSTSILVIIGAVLSIILYRHQRSQLERMKEVEAQLHRQREEANLGRYAAAIAHEIRNPLNAVSMGIQKITMKKKGLPDTDRKLLRVLLEELNRVARIISDLLNYARPVEPSPERIDLSAMMDRAVLLARQRYPEKEIRVEVTGPRPLYAQVDPDLFYQVISNLVLNAFEAYSDQGRVKIALSSKGPVTEITVANKGELPNPDQIEQIFEPYFTKKVRGTGLGLAVARRIVKAHGGSISACMDKEGWLVIKIVLPALQKGDRGGQESNR